MNIADTVRLSTYMSDNEKNYIFHAPLHRLELYSISKSGTQFPTLKYIAVNIPKEPKIEQHWSEVRGNFLRLPHGTWHLLLWGINIWEKADPFEALLTTK
jgi:hypothetical protein